MARRLRSTCRPTLFGYKGLVLLAALEVAFLATAYNNLFFLLLAFSCVLGVLGHAWANANLRGVQLVRLVLPTAAAGAERPVRVLLRAPRRRRFDVAVTLSGPRGLELAHTPVLDGERELDGSLRSATRGLVLHDRVVVVSHFPFGLFEARRELACEFELVTTPEPLAAAEQARLALLVGDATARDTGRGASVAALRPFRSGDALGDVHWKATARRGAPIVKQRERDDGSGVDVVFDRRAAPAVFERALGELQGLAALLKDRAALRVQSQGHSGGVDRDRGGSRDFDRWLASVQPLPLDAESPPHRPGALRLPRPEREAMVDV